VTEQGRDLIRQALAMRDQGAMDHLVFHMVATGAFEADDVERVLHQELATATHEVQTYWLGVCNCAGHLN